MMERLVLEQFKLWKDKEKGKRRRTCACRNKISG